MTFLKRNRDVLIALTIGVILGLLVNSQGWGPPLAGPQGVAGPVAVQVVVTATLDNLTPTYSAPIGLPVTVEGIGVIYYVGVTNLNGARLTVQYDGSMDNNEAWLIHGRDVQFYDARFTPPSRVTGTVTPTRTPTRTATGTVAPTRTPTQTATGTVTPTRTPTSVVSGAWYMVNVNQIRVYAQPDSRSRQLGMMGRGSRLLVTRQESIYGYVEALAGWVDLGLCARVP